MKFPIMIHKTQQFELQQDLLLTNMKELGNASFRLWCSIASDKSEWIKMTVNSAANDISMTFSPTRRAIEELIEKCYLVETNEGTFDFFFWGGQKQ